MTDSSTIENELINEISIILGVKAAQVKNDVPFHSLGMDSMSFVELLVFIEKRFKLNLIASGLNKQDFENIKSLAHKIFKNSG